MNDKPTRGSHGRTHRVRGDRSTYERASIQRLLARIGPTNRAWVEPMAQRMLNQRIRPSSVRLRVHACMIADRELAGLHFKDATPEDIRQMMHELGQRKKDSTVKSYSVHLKAAWKEALGADSLPRPVRVELTVRKHRTEFRGTVITQEQFAALLRCAESLPGTRLSVMACAVLWALWDSGMRAREVLSLRVGDVRLDPEGALLCLDPAAEGLKTGPRDVYVCEAMPWLRAWLQLHPAGGNPLAPLWLSGNDKDGSLRMGYLSLHALLQRLSKNAGFEAHVTTGHIRPHDFRHTRVTRAAMANWSEAKMRAYFGWSEGSTMPSRYAHLRDHDLKEQVLRDAKAARVDAAPSITPEALADAFSKMLQRGDG